ncbi:hypothetical protein C8J56DRAFT_211021 [Mycena floridula]|nr:hypothetical protein C8J56DRAFT_211021 [Mycena floridula]
MAGARYSTFASLLWLAATSLGTITLNIPDHIIVEQQTVVSWARSVQAPPVSDSAIRTVPSINFQAGDLQTDSQVGLSGTITVVFHESPTGFVQLEVVDQNNPDTVYTTSAPFEIFNVDGTTGPEGNTTSTDSGSSDTLGAPATSTSSPNTGTTVGGTSLSQTAVLTTPTASSPIPLTLVPLAPILLQPQSLQPRFIMLPLGSSLVRFPEPWLYSDCWLAFHFG